jgi:hypothetical protein
MQRIEVGDAIDARNHSLAIDHELLAPIPERSRGYPQQGCRIGTLSEHKTGGGDFSGTFYPTTTRFALFCSVSLL